MTFENKQIDINSLPTIEKTVMVPIEKDYYKVILINSLITYFFLFFIVLGAVFINTNKILDQILPLIVSMLFIGILFHFFITKVGFKNRRYAVRERDISYVEGWIHTRHYTVPFVRTQHVEIRQGLISKYFNLSNLKVFTAGDGEDVYIKGLTTEKAEEIRSFIISKINEGV